MNGGRPPSLARPGVSLLWSLTLAACSAPTAGVHDGDGRIVDPRVVPTGCVHVVVFTSHECPIANGYAPTLQELARVHTAPAVRWFFVHVDPDLEVAAARDHAQSYGLPGTLLFDRRHDLASALQVTKTPEVVVLSGNEVCYRGRIDDQWRALGTRGAATQQDLAQAIERARRGQATPAPWPAAVGCLLPEPR